MSKNRIDKILKTVQKPGRYIGGEWNSVLKDPQKVQAKIALVFPDVYEVGMSYLGQKILYSILNEDPRFLAERVFTPWPDFEEKLRKSRIPLFSLENRIPLKGFDIIGFSLLYELNYSNILTVLDLAGIPFLSLKRDRRYPLVIAGGPGTFNPEPLADIFDLFLIGDGEEAIIEILEKYLTVRSKSREAQLEKLSMIKGVYIPSFYKPFRVPNSPLLAVEPYHNVPSKIRKRLHRPLKNLMSHDKTIVPNIKIIFDRIAMEVARGCPQKCRFCQATNLYFPPRFADPAVVIEKILESLLFTGYENASLSALSIADYPDLEDIVRELMDRLEPKKISLSLPSIRPGGLSYEIAERISRVRKTGFTLVPEAGTDRLRCVINKHMKNSELYEAAQNAYSRGWRLLKLYFMIGLPTEDTDDLEGIVSIVKELLRLGQKELKSVPRINLSISSFIPKPHTPFQWMGMDNKDNLKYKQHFIKKALSYLKTVKINVHPVETSMIEGIFARGDRKLNSVLTQAWQEGARFDSWSQWFSFDLWREVFQKKNIDIHEYLQSFDSQVVFPWDMIDTGLKKEYLQGEYQKALSTQWTKPCIELDCQECQGCYENYRLSRRQRDKAVRIKKSSVRRQKSLPERITRYWAAYSKIEAAKYLSHQDLNNLIQRGFRRAGIRVAFSKGFHPSMSLSFLPALPLGMEGKEEWLEFRSLELIPEKKFLTKLNRSLIEGVRFIKLMKPDESFGALNRNIHSFLYSFDMKDISPHKREKARKKLVNYLQKYPEIPLGEVVYSSEEGKLFFKVNHTVNKPIRFQDIIKDALNIENPVYWIVREKILLKQKLN